MSKMVLGFRQKIESVLQSPRALTTRAILKMVLGRLKQITERDDITRELFLIVKINVSTDSNPNQPLYSLTSSEKSQQ